MSLISRVCLRGSTAKRLAHHWVFSVCRGSAKASSRAIFPFMVGWLLYDALLGERESWEEVVWWFIYKILQWETSFARARFIDVMRTNFFSSKSTPQRLPFVCRKERRGEKRGEVGKCTFNLILLRMRVNNTYPMESYFFPPQNHIGFVHSMQSASRSERERQKESPPGPPSINPSRSAKKGGIKKGACLVISPGPITQVM